MRRGPPPKPTHLKVVAGNPGRRPLNEREPKPPVGVPPCPDHLTPVAKAEWRRVSKLLAEVGLLTEIDRSVLASYCQAWGRWVEAERALAKHGTLVKSPNGHPIQSPYLAIANKAMRQMHELALEFGMTPASRSRIKAGEPEQQRDPAEAFFA